MRPNRDLKAQQLRSTSAWISINFAFAYVIVPFFKITTNNETFVAIHSITTIRIICFLAALFFASLIMIILEYSVKFCINNSSINVFPTIGTLLFFTVFSKNMFSFLIAVLVVVIVTYLALAYTPQIRVFCRYFLVSQILVLLVLVFQFSQANQHEKNANNVVTSKQENIVLLIFDELSIGAFVKNTNENLSIDMKWFPNFARMAREGTWFPNAISPFSATSAAIPSILNGKIDKDVTQFGRPLSGIAALSKSHLPIIYSGTNYDFCIKVVCLDTRTNYGKLSSFHASLRDSVILTLNNRLSSSMRKLLSIPNTGIRMGNFEREFPTAKESISTWLSSIANMSPSTRYVGIFHSMVTHYPWLSDNEGLPFANRETPFEDGSWMPGSCEFFSGGASLPCNQEILDFDLRLNTANAMAADFILGEILSYLDRVDPTKKTTLIVTSDHGVALDINEDSRYPSNKQLMWSDVASSVLMIRGKEIPRGKIESRVVSPVQILSTLGVKRVGGYPSLLSPEVATYSHNGINFLGTNLGISRISKQKGALTNAVNSEYPYAVGKSAKLVGMDISELNTEFIRKVNVAKNTNDITRKLWRAVIYGEMTDDDCNSGLPVVASTQKILGTVARSTKKLSSGLYRFWSIAQDLTRPESVFLACVRGNLPRK